MDTSKINARNVQNVRSEISKKLSSQPYYATKPAATSVLTDYDTFPYPRWWRGVPASTLPIVAERESGWRPRRDSCYRVVSPALESPYPDGCFQTSCSTTYPCYRSYVTNYQNRDKADLLLNRACVVQYR